MWQANFRSEAGADAGKPLLFIDIDGVISLWGFDLDRRPPGAFTQIDGVLHFLSHDAGRHLLATVPDFEPVWCTGWEEKANEHLPGALGLGPFPHVELDRHARFGMTTPGHWKLAALDAWAGDRPLAWIDDALNEACVAWAAGRPRPTLLVETSPAEGFTERHAAKLRAWAREVVAGGTGRG